MKFNEKVGEITFDVSDLRNFVKNWFSPDDLVVLTAISVDTPNKRVLSQTIPATELVEITNEELEELCHEEGDRYNMYLSCFPVKEENENVYSRSTKDDIKEIFGVYADLDVKEGCFESKEEIRDFLYSLEAPPTLIVDNGQYGGVHAYWRLNYGETTEELTIMKWWCYLTSKTNKNIDRLKDSTRMLRLPSGIYWKTGGADVVRLVVSDGPRYSEADLLALSDAPFQEREKRIKETIVRDQDSRQSVGPLAVEIFSKYNNSGYTSWSTRIAVSKLEQVINDSLSWFEILVPNGWMHLRELRDGANEWARPGQTKRSAVTDFSYDGAKASNVMSLLSQSPDTGLLDLLDARIPLTKYRVHLRLNYKDDEVAMLNGMRNRIFRPNAN